MIFSPRALSRRSVAVLAVVGIIVGALLLASNRLDGLCPDGDYCDALSRLRQHVPSIHQQAPVTGPENQQESSETESTTFPPPPPAQPSPPVAAPQADPAPTDPACEHFPDTSNVLLVMKTGASEAYSKIPTQGLTGLRCLPDYLVFSDMEQEVAGIHIHDSLDEVHPAVANSSSDFDLYHRQKKCASDQDACNKHFDTAAEGWALDKYKNVHMAEKTYRLRPGYDWYLFVDADTYVLWPTMLEWLKKLNPQEPLYLGSVAYVGSTPFGHGGSGYLVSQAAMHALFYGKDDVASQWDERTTHECCGDFMFAVALNEATGTPVNNTWPTINGEKPFTLAYGESQWCQPIATMHHIGSEEVSDFFAFEQARNFSSPMRIRDIYHEFVAPRLKNYRLDWDNTSDDWMYADQSRYKELEGWEQSRVKSMGLTESEKVAHLNSNNCHIACEDHEDCFQWKYTDGVCSFSGSFRHGHPTKTSAEMKERTFSGWNLDKINAFIEEHRDCGELKWPDLNY